MYVHTFKKFKSHIELTRLLTLFALQLQGVSNFNLLPIEVQEYYCKDNTSVETELQYLTKRGRRQQHEIDSED